MFRESLFIAFMINFLLSVSYAYALAPPTGQETPCIITGKVTEMKQGEISDEMMNKKTEVPFIVVNLDEISAVDPSYKGNFCRKPVADADGKTVSTYRLCDATAKDIKAGDQITGTTKWSNLGGGPYCIEKIKIIK